MRLLFFDDYKMGMMKDGQIVDVSFAIPNHDILPPNTQMERVIADFGSYKPKFEEIASNASGVSVGSVRLRASLPQPHYLLCASGHEEGVASFG